MQAERWKKIEKLYQAAVALSAEKRADYLAQACPGDPDLRAEVLSLLAQNADSFLESSPVSAVKPLSAGAKLGNFETVELIGRGGMGEVYRARDSRLKRDVAIKVLPAELSRDPDRIARFEREARSAGALNHPNIVAVYDIGRDGDTYWIATELVAGESLAKVVERGPLAVPKVMEIATQIADGLAAAHAAGIVHRDLKPANIMVTRGGRVKILDFGLALRQRTSQDSTTIDMTDEGTVLGTAGYMSPEQVRGEPVDHRSDLFSFGVILYEMLGGKRAFAGASSVEVLHAILKEEPGELPASVPPALDRIVRRCLQKERERRFQTAADLEFALQTPDSAQPPAKLPQHRAWLTWALLAGLCVAAACAGFLWLDRPLPMPHVTGIVQLTGGSGNSPPLLTDGTRLFFDLAFDPHQVSVKGGEVAAFQPSVIAWPVDISPDRTEMLMYANCEAVNRCPLLVAPLLGGPAHRLGDLLATTAGLGQGLNADGPPDASGFPTPLRPGFEPLPYQAAAAWSPDGQQLVYARENELHLARNDGTEIRKLATVAGYPFFVRWSPDGRRIRLSVSAPGDVSASLWEVSVDDGRQRPLLPGWNPSWYTCCGNWTPNGKYYVFQSRGNIWAVRERKSFFQRASEPVQLTTGPMEASWPLPSLDGKRVFIGGYNRHREFLRFDLTSGAFSTALPGVSGTELDFSKSGKSIAYISMPQRSLMLAAADGSRPVQLTRPPMVATLPRWSPDGQIAFVGSYAGKPPRIFVTQGSTYRQVSNGEGGPGGDGDPSWSPDSTAIAFGSPGDAGQPIRVLDLKTNRVSGLPGSEGMWSPRWSPDGRFIAGLSAGSSKPVLYDVQTRKQTVIFDDLGGYPSWALDGESLFFMGRPSSRPLSQRVGWWRLRMSDRKLEKIPMNMVPYVRLIDTDLSVKGFFGLWTADWGWFAAAPNNSLMTVTDSGNFEIYALEWDARWLRATSFPRRCRLSGRTYTKSSRSAVLLWIDTVKRGYR
jgi:Tol biopolymer transport system component